MKTSCGKKYEKRLVKKKREEKREEARPVVDKRNVLCYDACSNANLIEWRIILSPPIHPIYKKHFFQPYSTINPTWTSSHFHHSSPQSSGLGFVIHVDVFGTKEIPAGEHAIDVDSFFHHAHINTYIHPYCL